jgi:hypothetical protein
VEPTDGNHEVGVVTEPDEQAHLAVDSDEQHSALVKAREEPAARLVEFECADEAHLQDDDGEIIGRKCHP